ncbi:unnamed protein product, partial [Cylicostephanus goldi]
MAPHNIDKDDEDYIEVLTTKEETIQKLRSTIKYLDNLWSLWTAQYILELRNFHQKRIRQKSFTRKIPAKGEVVLIMDENTKRGSWPMGIIEAVKYDPDGEIREVTLRTAQRATLTRSINMLVPLELDSENKKVQSSAQTDESLPNDEGNVDTGEPKSNEEDQEHAMRSSLPRKAKENVHYVYNTTMTVLFLFPHQAKAQKTPVTSIKTECILGGVNIYGVGTAQRLQICGEHHCVEINDPKDNVTIQFPPE